MGNKLIRHLPPLDGEDSGEIVIVDDRSLDEAQQQAIASVEAQFATLVNQGCNVAVGDATKAYQIDDASRNNIAGIAAMAVAVALDAPGVSWPGDGLPWIAADNTQQAMTAENFLSFGQTVANYYTDLVLNSRALKDTILACATNEDCDAVDVSAGWPSNS